MHTQIHVHLGCDQDLGRGGGGGQALVFWLFGDNPSAALAGRASVELVIGWGGSGFTPLIGLLSLAIKHQILPVRLCKCSCPVTTHRPSQVWVYNVFEAYSLVMVRARTQTAAGARTQTAAAAAIASLP